LVQRIALPSATGNGGDRTFGRKFLYALIVGIGNVKGACFIDRQGPGKEQLIIVYSDEADNDSELMPIVIPG